MSFSIPPLPLTASLPTPPPPPPSNSSTSQVNNTTPKSQSNSSKRIQMTLGMLLPHTPSSESSPFHSNTSSNSKLKPNSINTCSKSSLSASPPPNPFFDNIRQLNERLSLSGSLQHLTPMDLPTLSNPIRDLPRLPHFLARLFQESPQDRAKRLAHEFHDLEMAEQLRLQDVMRWESSRGYSIRPTQIDNTPQQTLINDSHDLTTYNYHPFSISAGVELGYKNRYKNIWPYEHARIRLKGVGGRRNETDYVNASRINFKSGGGPLGNEVGRRVVGQKRYIATQGPLTSTFEDFWSVVVEEDVGLIIMITRRHEAGREKCADYLRNGQFGETVVSVNHQNDLNSNMESDSDEERDQVTGFFGFTSAAQFSNNNHNDDSINNNNQNQSNSNTNNNRLDGKKKGGILTKTIQLSRATRPDLPARKIGHIQYRGWPDFDVPPAAEEVLDLIHKSHLISDQMVELNDHSIDQYFNEKKSINNKDNKNEDRKEIEKIVGRGTGPVIVHCSAGVGRTGSFILLDVMVDVLRAQYLSSPTSSNPTSINTNNQMNLSGTSSTTTTTPKPMHINNPCQTINPSTQQQPLSDDNDEDENNLSILPKFLNSQLCDCTSNIAPVWHKFPVMSVVNEMREQRMSMVANYRQYVFLHEVLIKFMINELKIPVDQSNVQVENNNNIDTIGPEEEEEEGEQQKKKKKNKEEEESFSNTTTTTTDSSSKVAVALPIDHLPPSPDSIIHNNNNNNHNSHHNDHHHHHHNNDHHHNDHNNDHRHNNNDYDQNDYNKDKEGKKNKGR